MRTPTLRKYFLSAAPLPLGTRLKLALAITIGVAGTPALAAEQSANAAPPGSIVISRDVPTRHAHLPGEPGEANAVVTAPTTLILEATGQAGVPLTVADLVSFSLNGILPLSDDEIAGVASGQATGLPGLTGATDDALSLTQKLSMGSQTAQLSSNALGDMIGAIGSSVQSATGAAFGAISNIGSALREGGP